MITANGYSKDPNIIPEGIVLTMPVAFFEDRKMSIEEFKIHFEKCMDDEETTWNFLLTSLPRHEVLYAYILFDKKIQYRCNLVCFERNESKAFIDAKDKKLRCFKNKNWVIISGPAVKAPQEIRKRGFQGFRYCTKLF